jgi:diadenylate cyclase
VVLEYLQQIFSQVRPKDIFDILLVAFIIYHILLIIHGTRALQMLIGVIILLGLFWLSVSFKFYSLNWILSHFFGSFLIIAVIVFQDQVRSALAQVGMRRFFGIGRARSKVDQEIEEVVEACGAMSREKIGALIVFERTNGLANYIETGTKLTSIVHADLIYAIFQSQSPLHDGAAIIQEGKLQAAGCFLPLSKTVEIDRHFGTRHRAALGISEVTDALAVVVSEESGQIKICLKGKFYNCDSENTLRQYLKHLWTNDALEDKIEPIISVGEN